MCDFYGALIPAHLGSARLRSVLFSLVLFVRLGLAMIRTLLKSHYPIGRVEIDGRRRTGQDQFEVGRVFTVVLSWHSAVRMGWAPSMPQ